MKKPIQILSFSLIALLIHVAISHWYTHTVMRESLVQRIENQLISQKSKIETLILGDSHAQFALNPKHLENGFNFSTAGSSYIHHYYKLKQLLSQPNSIETVILPFENHSFSNFVDDEPQEEWYWNKYLDYGEIAQISEQSARYLRMKLTGKLTPYIGKRNNILQFFGSHHKNRTLIDGFTPHQGSNDSKDFNQPSRAEYHFKDQEIFNHTLLKYFRMTLELAKEHDLNIVLLRYPVSSKYNEQASNYIEMDQYINLLNDVLIKDSPMWFLDYFSSYSDDFFYDPDHLNSNGADALSKEIASQLNVLRKQNIFR